MFHALITTVIVAAAAATSAPPVCAVRAGQTGGPAIVINGKAYTPLLFMANNQFNRDEILLQELAQAAAAGVALFGFQVGLDWWSNAEQAAATVDKFASAHPGGYYFLQIWLGPNREWTEANPDECITQQLPDGSLKRLPLASVTSRPWREATRAMLIDRVRQIAQGPHGGRLAGVSINYLQTGEWFYPETDAFADYSPANLAAFRQWLRAKYIKEDALRAAWNDAGISFDSVPIPTPDARQAGDWGPFRDPARHQAAIDFQVFQAESMADTIASFAAAVKEATNRRTLTGAYYGYTFELNHNGPRALAHSGHLALARLLECPDIDLLYAPVSYFERARGMAGHMHAPLNSIALHNKLAIAEEDMYTHLAQEPDDRRIAPGWEQRTASLNETLDVVRRDFATMLTRGAGMWLFDLLSDGRWHETLLWQETTLLRRLAAEQRSVPPFQPEVAFVADEQAVHYLHADTYPHLVQALACWRSELDRIGTPVGYYLLSDLDNLPDRVKVVILPNAYRTDKKIKRAINRLFERGATVIFCYAPGIIDDNQLAVSNIALTTGIPIEHRTDTVPIAIRSELTPDEILIEPAGWNPRFVVTGSGDVVARYTQTSEVSAAAVPMKKGVSIYTATPRLPIGLLREICRRAGVHLYRDTPGMTAVTGGNCLIVHTETGNPHTFSWPRPWKTIERLAPEGPSPRKTDIPTDWIDTLSPGTTAIYRITE